MRIHVFRDNLSDPFTCVSLGAPTDYNLMSKSQFWAYVQSIDKDEDYLILVVGKLIAVSISIGIWVN